MDMMFFDSWDSVLRTLVIGALAYVSLILFLRASGKRTLTKLNAFDLVVTIALGSTLATVLLNKDVALVDGLVAFALLIGLQFVVTWTAVRWRWVRQLVTGEPVMLLHRGELLPEAMRRARVTEDEVRSALRSAGLAELAGAEAVVLETDGSLSVVKRNPDADRSSLAHVIGPVERELTGTDHADPPGP
jgi:uncharacterized membrane protein YcaP (DUF421 family)